jgi:hypothetical protein
VAELDLRVRVLGRLISRGALESARAMGESTADPASAFAAVPA